MLRDFVVTVVTELMSRTESEANATRRNAISALGLVVLNTADNASIQSIWRTSDANRSAGGLFPLTLPTPKNNLRKTTTMIRSRIHYG